MNIALITARGGSTRVPRKNLVDICGLPLVAWSILQANACKAVDKVYLTTDDDEIDQVGQAFGATIIRRPVMDNGVTAGVPFLHAVRLLEEFGEKIDSILCLLPTSPLRRPGDLDRLMDAHLRTGLTVTTAVPQKETFIMRLDRPFQERFDEWSPDSVLGATQLLGDKFWNYAKLGGGESAATRDSLVETWEANPPMDYAIDTSPVNTTKPWTLVPIEEWQAFEIDYPQDVELVRQLFNHYLKHDGKTFPAYWR